MAKGLKEYVDNALDAAGDEPSSAVDVLLQYSETNHHLRDILLHLGAKEAVSRQYREARRSAVAISIGRVMSNIDREEIEERSSSRMARKAFWEKYTLFGMKPLRVSTQCDLTESAKNRRVVAKSHTMRAEFEDKISTMVSGEEMVCDKMTNTDVEKIAADMLS